MERWRQTRYGGLKLSELISALSHALDMTEGQPPGHCVRCCWIGMQLADQLGLDSDARWELYYTLLLKDLGCSSNAARICELYGTDDLSFKRDFKWVNGSLGQVVRFLLQHTGRDEGLAKSFQRLLRIALLAQVVDVFHTAAGAEATLAATRSAVARHRQAGRQQQYSG
jgi:hypothetical protein